MAVLAPIPSAMVTIAVAANTGLFARVRAAYVKSRNSIREPLGFRIAAANWHRKRRPGRRRRAGRRLGACPTSSQQLRRGFGEIRQDDLRASAPIIPTYFAK